MAIPHLPFTEQQLQAMGLPPRHEADNTLGGAHLVVTAAEVGAHALEHFAPVATAAAGVLLAFVGPPVAAYAGLHEVADAHEEGDALARRNAWKTGFAHTLQAMARGRNWHASNVRYRDWETRGRNAVIVLLRNLTRQERQTFLRQFGGSDGYGRAMRGVRGVEG